MIKKKTAVILYPQFSEYELTVALSILMQGKKPIVTVGLDQERITGESGLTCLADRTMEEVKRDEIDSILLPGCMDIFSLIDEAAYIHFINRIGTSDKVIGSISSSPLLLAKAGVLKGKNYTVGLTEETRRETGVFEEEKYSNELVIQDGNLITARGRGFVEFGIYFGRALNLQFDKAWYGN